MKSFVLLTLLAFVFIGARAQPSPQDPPHELSPYTVHAAPLGYIGVKHATMGFNPFRYVFGAAAVRYLRIDELYPDSPAIKAGIAPGDRVVALDDVPITSIPAKRLRHLHEEVQVGQRLRVRVFRPQTATTHSFEVTLFKQPPRSEAALEK